MVISNFIKVNVTKILLTPSPKSGILGEHALFFHYTSQHGGRTNFASSVLVNLQAISLRMGAGWWVGPSIPSYLVLSGTLEHLVLENTAY